MKEKSNINKYIIIGVLVITVLVLLVWKCSTSTDSEQGTGTEGEESTIPYHSTRLPLIAQKSQKSCWVASLEMTGQIPQGSLNQPQTASIFTDSLSTYLPSQNLQILQNQNEISWIKLQEALLNDEKIIVYKYFNPDFAHVFVVKGYQESNGTKWLLLNDPWPENKAKTTVVSFKQFIKPYNGLEEYTQKTIKSSSDKTTTNTESALNIFSESKLSSNSNSSYLPPRKIVNIKKFKEISKKNIKGLLKEQAVLVSQFDKDLFKQMNVSYDPETQKLEPNLNSILRLYQITDKVKFLNYDLVTSNSRDNISDYLFDGDLLAFLNLDLGTQPILNVAVEYVNDATEPYLFISRFEPYANSTKADWDIIVKDMKKAMSIPKIKELLYNLGLAKASVVSTTRSSTQIQSVSDSLRDVASLALFGGNIYSFTLPSFNERIVADPYRQVNLKPGKKALFRGASGTYYYRLSDIDIPDRETFVDRESPIEEQWREEVIKDPNQDDDPNDQGGNDSKDPNQNDDGTGTGSTKDPKGKREPIPIGKPNNEGTKPIKVDPNIEKRPRKILNQELTSPVKAIPKVKEVRKRQ